MNESTLVASVLLALGSRSDCKMWRSNSGTLMNPRTGRWVKFGVPGQGDITGLLRGGRRLEIECKSYTGRASTAQVAFRSMIEAMGGLYILARSVEEAVQAVTDTLTQKESHDANDPGS